MYTVSRRPLFRSFLSHYSAAPLHIPGWFWYALGFHFLGRGARFPTFGTNELSTSRRRTSWFPSRKMSWCTQCDEHWEVAACGKRGGW